MTPENADLVVLEKRLGRRHARARLGIEQDHEAQIFGQGINFFHIENLTLSHAVIRAVLMASGLYWRGRDNAAKVEMRENRIVSPRLPKAFDGFTILQLSDLHVEISEAAMERVIHLVKDASYDLCVLTGDYRAKTWGPYDAALSGVARVRAALHGEIYGVLGNHDTICMVPGLEAMGIRMLLNENAIIERAGERIHLAGVDDPHYYRMDNLEKAAVGDSFRGVHHSPLAHAGNLPAGVARRFRRVVERAHPWRPDLPSRPHPDYARFGVAAIPRLRTLAPSRHDRLHLGRCRLLGGAGALQLPARDHPASSSRGALSEEPAEATRSTTLFRRGSVRLAVGTEIFRIDIHAHMADGAERRIEGRLAGWRDNASRSRR